MTLLLWKTRVSMKYLKNRGKSAVISKNKDTRTITPNIIYTLSFSRAVISKKRVLDPYYCGPVWKHPVFKKPVYRN
jgi:hypothetical protein